MGLILVKVLAPGFYARQDIKTPVKIGVLTLIATQLLSLTGLLLAGGFALFLAASGEFLPHDIRYLGMSADDLCDVASCRIVDFMIHDRAAFGGTLVGLGVVYLWLTLFPLAAGEQWAWWVWLVSGTVGFLSFLSYLGYESFFACGLTPSVLYLLMNMVAIRFVRKYREVYE